jgi:hypothetical protein
MNEAATESAGVAESTTERLFKKPARLHAFEPLASTVLTLEVHGQLRQRREPRGE